ncbi:MAG: hypothetical protein K0R67_1385 [Paenibacillus sp.]|nr:hypothetical protein [Paenibacillus sp.]
MDNTHEYVEKLHENQKKAKKNKEHQGDGNPSKKLSSKQHSTNK